MGDANIDLLKSGIQFQFQFIHQEMYKSFHKHVGTGNIAYTLYTEMQY